MSSYKRENYHAWTWGIAALLALALLWMWLTGRGPSANCCGAPAAAVAAAPAAPMPAPSPAPVATPAPAPVAAAPAAASAAAPPAAPAIAAPKPVAKLYFATGKIDAPVDTNAIVADVVSYLKANPASKAVISGFNDPRGDAAVNAELSKNRAKAAREALKGAGIDEARIELRKPVDATQGGDLKEARRVEISVEP
jgi:outer membrane protein OmpA-like peptidoglycan-associated protein